MNSAPGRVRRTAVESSRRDEAAGRPVDPRADRLRGHRPGARGRRARRARERDAGPARLRRPGGGGPRTDGPRVRSGVPLAVEFAVQWTPLLQEAWYAAVTRSRLVRWFYREVMGAWVAGDGGRLAASRPTSSSPPTSSPPPGWRGCAAGAASTRASSPRSATSPRTRTGPTRASTSTSSSTTSPANPPARWHRVPRSPCARRWSVPPRPGRRRRGPRGRRALDLPDDALVVVVTAGSLGLGGVAGAVRAALAADPSTHVVALCGRDDRARTRLRSLRARTGAGTRLRVPGWVDDVPTLLAAADVVVNDFRRGDRAGGARLRAHAGDLPAAPRPRPRLRRPAGGRRPRADLPSPPRADPAAAPVGRGPGRAVRRARPCRPMVGAARPGSTSRRYWGCRRPRR